MNKIKKLPDFKSKIFIRMLVILSPVILASCTYVGGSEQPVFRKFTWFSYVAADDIKKGCTVGSEERYRFVYNGVYNEQVRTYDISPAETGRFNVKIHVTGEAKLNNLVNDLGHPDLFLPWRPKISSTNISNADVSILRRTLKDAQIFDSPTFRENLPSIGFYWVVSACIDGEFNQNAVLWPNESFTKSQFGKLLSVWDFTDISVNPPRKTSNFSVYGTNDEDEYTNHFNLRIGS